jgi:dihydrofolate synthase/folylpolyglutamate synthase
MPKPTPAGPRKVAKAGVTAPHAPIEVKSPAPTQTKASEIENYTDALRYLSERHNIERTRVSRVSVDDFKLDRMRALAAALGNPQNDVRCVHVAGSKGKGSVVEMTASALTACGYATGVYTSPHLVDVRERIRINADQIGYPAFTKVCQRVAAAAEGLDPGLGAASFFEVLTAMAFCYFAEQAVDIAVIEVGLGGRLDATNIVQPEVTAVTAIQLEHTQLLGDTLEKIAAEKAGIFKPGIPSLTIPQTPGVMQVIREAAEKAMSPLQVVGQDLEFSYRFEASPELGPHTRVCLTTPRSNFEHLPVPLKGEHQAHNCGLSLAILDALRGRGFDTPERHVAEGLSRTPFQGRMEIVGRSPRIVIDGAHTPESVQALVKAIGAHVRYDSMVVIFGCAEDKDVKGMLSKIGLGADKIIFTRSAGNARSADPKELARRYMEATGKMAQVARTLPDALDMASQATGRDDLICITGSFYLAGEAKKHLAEMRGRR